MAVILAPDLHRLSMSPQARKPTCIQQNSLFEGKQTMKKFALILLVFLSALPIVAQTIAGAPQYQLPSTVVAQKWYGTAAPTAALNYPTQPGDLFFDTTNKNLYWCAAPVTSTNGLAGGPPACSSVASGQWTLIAGSAGAILPVANGGTGSASLTGVVTQSIVIPLTLSQLQTLFSVGVQILPQPAATSMYVMGPCLLNLTYGSAAFTGGGTVSLGYGNTFASTTPSPLTHGTIASTVFTTFSASHGVVVIPAAVAVTATTSLAGKAVFMSAATQDFAAGNGGSGQLSCQYSIVPGVS
jgi:hypothetical protein